MGVQTIDFKKGICAVCRQKSVTRWCDFVVRYDHAVLFLRGHQDFIDANRRGAQYKTCDLPMCVDCAHNVSLDHDLCPHHKMLQDMARLPDDYQRQRQQREQTTILQRELDQAEVTQPSEGDSDQMTLFDE